MNSEQMLKAVTHICRYFEGFEGEIVLDSIGRLARELLDSDIHVMDDSGTSAGQHMQAERPVCGGTGGAPTWRPEKRAHKRGQGGDLPLQ